MEKFSHMDKLMNVMMHRKFACCFYYDSVSDKCEYYGNVAREKVFGSAIENPLKGMISENSPVTETDKPDLEEFLIHFGHAQQGCSEPTYFETLVHVKIDGEMIPMTCSFNMEMNEDGIAIGFTGYLVSIINFDFKMKRNISTDRTRFDVNKVIDIMMTTKENYAVVEFDINRFKLINSRYGDEAGDAVLENIRVNIADVWGRPSITARLGADIFVVFTEYSDRKELEDRIQNVRDKLQSYKNISYHFSFGVYLVNDKSVPLRTMTDNAAIARRKSKSNAINIVQYYEEKFTEALKNRHIIESEMETALETGQFQVFLQPKCNISDSHVIGAEALVRWFHPEKGIIPPDKFIPIFESNGFIRKLDMFMHRRVCQIIRKWLDAGVKPVPVSVNVSRVYLDDPNLANELKEVVEEYDIPLELFQVEITETYENKEADSTIKRLKKAGFTLLMDDFGSGYSSLNTLKNTPFDVIKLDREFFGHSMLTDRGQKILTHTIAMTNDIGMEIVAEGVETKEQAAFLDANGCKFAQGYLYYRPEPLDVFEENAFGHSVPE
jgi:diguanylate cyclase (GGDEF)-like protein